MGFTAQKFAYQHPTFGRGKDAKSREPYKNSVYYLWWEFLKRNEGYEKCCKSGGKGKFAKLYKDFGDIHSADFKSWWQKNNLGVTLFAEVLPPEFKVIVDPADVHRSDKTIYLQVSLDLPKRFLSSQFQKILNKHHSGTRGRRTNRYSTAKYPVTGHVDTDALQKCLRVYDMKNANPKMRWWEVAQKSNATRNTQVIKSGDTPAEITSKKLVLSNTAVRLYKKAVLIIEGVGNAEFPKLIVN
jgi:hypothetical protein